MKKRIVSFFVITFLLLCAFSAPALAVGDVIDFTKDSINLYLEQSYQLTMKNNAAVTGYNSSDPDIVSVSETGSVKALKAGSSIITASDSSGNQASCTVTVFTGDPPTGVRLEPTSLTLTEGESSALKASVIPADYEDNRVYFSSSDESVARVDEKGIVKAVGAGTAVITVEASSAAVSSQCMVTVESRVQRGIFSVEVNGTLFSVAGEKKANMVIELSNDSESLEATTNTDGKFSFENVVQGEYTLKIFKSVHDKTPSAAGKITVNSYDMTITCIMNNKEIVTLYQEQTVATEEVRDVSLEKSSINIEVGSSYDMSFKVTPSNAVLPTMNGRSDNEKVAVVDIDGRITGVSEGTATITFKTADGKISKNCKVTVVMETRNTYSWIIITIEAAIIITVFVMFMISYRKFMKNKEREEGLIPDKKKGRRFK